MKCPFCNEKIVKFPLRGKDGKFLWKNLFKMDMMSFVFLVCIIALFLMVRVDVQNYKEILSNPVKFCEESNACEVIEEQKLKEEFESGKPILSFTFNTTLPE